MNLQVRGVHYRCQTFDERGPWSRAEMVGVTRVNVGPAGEQASYTLYDGSFTIVPQHSLTFRPSPLCPNFPPQ